MKILVDTNVLISAIVFAGRPRRLLLNLISSGHKLIVTDYVLKEFSDVVEKKWPDKAKVIIEIFKGMDFVFSESTTEETDILIRDKKDIQVLSDAIYHEVDVVLSGDRDFLESEIEKPVIMSVAMLDEFLENRI